MFNVKIACPRFPAELVKLVVVRYQIISCWGQFVWGLEGYVFFFCFYLIQQINFLFYTNYENFTKFQTRNNIIFLPSTRSFMLIWLLKIKGIIFGQFSYRTKKHRNNLSSCRLSDMPIKYHKFNPFSKWKLHRGKVQLKCSKSIQNVQSLLQHEKF